MGEYIEHLIKAGTKFLLFGHHHATLNTVEDKLRELGVGYVRIDGGTPPAKRPELVTRFQDETIVRVAVLSITAAGAGLTLTAAQTVVFAELYWVPGQMQQAEDRAHRIGQRDSVVVQYLVASGTLDDVLFRSLERKTKRTGMILNGHECSLAASDQTPTHAAAQVAAAISSKSLGACERDNSMLTQSPAKRQRVGISTEPWNSSA